MEISCLQNRLGEDEIKRLNMITNLALNFLKSQAEQGRLVTVAAYSEKLREIVQLDGRPLIPKGHRGVVSKTAADEKVSVEITAYRQHRRLETSGVAEAAIADLVTKARQLAVEKRSTKKK